MITDVLMDHAEFVPVAALAVVLACVGGGYLVQRAERRGPGLARALAVLSLLPVVVLTLVPSSKGGSGEVACTVQFALPTPTRVELLANVVLFLPPALFATVASRRPWVVLLVASGTSAAIEAAQALAPAIGRACDTNDWFMNSIGVGVGVALALATTALARHPRVRKPDVR